MPYWMGHQRASDASLRILHESLLEYLSPFLEFNENGSGRQNFSDAFSKAQLDALVLC